MALPHELLEKIGNDELSRACDRATFELKIVLATWDGLAKEEEAALQKHTGAVLGADETKKVLDERLGAIKRGEPEEDRILESIGQTILHLPEALRPEVGRAILIEALPIIAEDRFVSGQERELVLDQVTKALCIERNVAESLFDQRAAMVKGR